MNIIVCVPTLKRYDLLDKLLLSCEASTVKPDRYIVVDNGGAYISNLIENKKTVVQPGIKPWGVAQSWNFFMHNFEGIKIIVNDDVEFYPDTIEKIVNAYNERPEDWFSLQKPGGMLLGFSCVVLRDSCFKDVGDFDETFFPAYYEDCDYLYRMNLLNKKEYHITCNWEHVHSATFKSLTKEEENNHHTTFKKNQDYYIKKWGGLPGKEIYKTPFNK